MWGQDGNLLYSAARVHLHLLHLVGIELLLDALCERRGQAVARGRLAAAVIGGRGKGIIDAQVGRKGQPADSPRDSGRALGDHGVADG